MSAKKYTFFQANVKKSLKFSELVKHFGGYFINEEGKRIVPNRVKLIVKANNQGTSITIAESKNVDFVREFIPPPPYSIFPQNSGYAQRLIEAGHSIKVH